MTQRILLADDSVTIRKVVELTFSDEDFTIDSVGDGAQALEHARAQRPDIIISDVLMPGMNGYELCRQVKADPSLRSVPFLFLKGSFESFDEEKAQACGSDGFIVKPFEAQEMIAQVRKLIERAVLLPPVAPAQPPPSIAAEPSPAAVPRVPVSPPAEPPPSLLVPTPVPSQRPPVPRAMPPVPPPARPGFALPRPLAQQPIAAVPPVAQPRPPAPPPVPVMHPRPAPAPPALPVMPARPVPPAAPRPVRPVEVAPPGEDFGFDLGEVESDRFGAPAQTPAHKPSAVAPDTSAESDEDLWSEVSLRGGASDLLEERAPVGSGAEPGADIVELGEETAITAPEGLFEDETVFEEVTTARSTLLSAPEPAAAGPRSTHAAAPPEKPEAAAVAIDQADLERMVASRVETAVRQLLEPIVRELSRATIESVAWEVIPDLAEAMIRAEIERVRQSSTRTD